MKIKTVDGTKERMILTAMILNDEVLSQIAKNLQGEQRPFQNKFANIISKWVLDHHEEYKVAPRETVQHRLQEYGETSKDEETVGSVEDLLRSLSREAKRTEEINVQYVVDEASKHFNKVRVEKLLRKASQCMEAGDAEGAYELIEAYEEFRFADADWGEMSDKEIIMETFAQRESEQLIQWPAALGEFLGTAFERDSFISFTGPEKRGKSFWLGEVVYQALKNRRRVMYIVTGDMSKTQTWLRFYQRLTRRPKLTQTLEIPTALTEGEEGVRVTKESREYPKATPKASWQAVQKLKKKMGHKEGSPDPLWVKVVPSSTITASDVEREVMQAAKKGIFVDVVVLDYADILLPEVGSRTMDFRHQQNETWKVLRRISQKFHCCVVTATQAAASSYKAPIIKMGDFSEDKRKTSHVTGMLGINQTPKEKTDGIYRLNWIATRDGIWADYQTVTTAGNLALACPCMVSAIF
jgi:hypothetical protein